MSSRCRRRTDPRTGAAASITLLADDGSTDPATFRDMEIVLRSADDAQPKSLHLGMVASFYYTVMFDYRGRR